MPSTLRWIVASPYGESRFLTTLTLVSLLTKHQDDRRPRTIHDDDDLV